MDLLDFDYSLPVDLIAQHPAPERDMSRLMVLNRAESSITHTTFRHLPDFLDPGDCLTVNESRVFPARLKGHRAETGGAVELLLLRRRGDLWEALVKPGRRLKAGGEIVLSDGDLTAVVEAVYPSGRRLIRFQGCTSLEAVLDQHGHIPLPPYIRREDLPEDRDRYQTVYARVPGAVAAPTAGLHFTPELLERLRASDVGVTPILLHVGPGTFKPVVKEDLRRHDMEAEYYEIGLDAAVEINRRRRAGGRAVCVGTTTVRALESAAERDGKRWAPVPGAGWTRLFIRPPYTYKLVDVLITNFHLPRSPLLMLVSAFAGREFVLKAYREAVLERYRFYSYGDAMLIL